MENYPVLVPLIILIPSIGAVINLFWGARLSEKWVGIVGNLAAWLSFLVAVLLFVYLSNSSYQAAIIDPPLLDGWIRLPAGGLEIPWQMRVDTLSVTMMLVVTGVGSLIHVYSIGYMHGDERFARFFAYLNMFLAFMLVLVTGNNLLMLFVGWEGVGLCSFLLIGFWFDKAKGVGWRNSNAARKAFIVNRIGDFGMLMAIFLCFWTFGTLDLYRPGEIANVHLAAGEHGEGAAEGESTDSAAVEGEAVLPESAQPEGGVLVDGIVYTDNEHIPTEQLGIFGQAERFLAEGRTVVFGPFSLPIATVVTIITLFMLLGATGKSAQIPLFIWLPDAMAGPTPVSALIHAATMVTAGVYMMVRSNVLFSNAELTSLVVTLVGAGTAIVAGFIAMGQWDIKKVLAYSTVSQLGFMVAAVGVGAYGAAMFHLVTHAFFKGLLFLGSGSVIHGMEHGHHHVHEHGHGHGHDAEDVHDAEAVASAHEVSEEGEEHGHAEEAFDPQDMRNMGGLRRRMPITYWTYLIGTLALSGIFPFAGFWSKDEILADSWLAGIVEGNLGGYIAFGVLLLAAGFTAFYMWRQVSLVFLGSPRTEAAEHAPESVPTMTIPLIVLAVFSLAAGLLNVPSGVLGLDNLFGAHRFTTWLGQSVAGAHAGEFQWAVALGALVIALGAIFLADNIYRRQGLAERNRDPLYVNRGFRPVWKLANARLYWDETYSRLFEQPFNRVSKFLADTVDWDFWHDYFHDRVIWRGFNAIGDLLSKPVDLGVIDGAVNGVGRAAQGIAASLRRVQTGYVRVYAISLLLGVVLVIIVLLLPMFGRG
jgi:NADH-quinone oxidoreductase subunit L